MPDRSLLSNVPGGMSRVHATVPLHNQRPVPPGVHHDVERPVPVTVTLRWETGVEELETVALEWWSTTRDPRDDAQTLGRSARERSVVRVRISDLRVMTGAIWVPAEDVRRR